MFHIIGQALAGTALAWALHERRMPFTIEDRGDIVTASRIAAGLITPITGKRFAVEDSFTQDYQIAKAFYRRIETKTGCCFFDECGAVRIFQNQEDRCRFEKKRNLDGHFHAAALNADWFHSPLGCFGFDGARLDVVTYLRASKSFFSTPISEAPERISKIVVDCTGISAMREGRLPAERFQPAKGEILTLKIPGLNEHRTIHHGIWLAHLHDDFYRAGATYSWDELDERPTSEGRDWIVSQLKRFLKLSFEIVDHVAAVRPITIDRKPIVERMDEYHWAFNGLGSKGALLAPRLARDLVRQLCGD